MWSYKRARQIADLWCELATNGKYKITRVDDKPYGWLFHYGNENYDREDPSTWVFGNASFIFNRFGGEIKSLGYPFEHHLKKYEATIPEIFLKKTPERHDNPIYK